MRGNINTINPNVYPLCGKWRKFSHGEAMEWFLGDGTQPEWITGMIETGAITFNKETGTFKEEWYDH